MAEEVSELLGRRAHGRCIDDRHHLFDVVDDHAVEEPFVPVLEGREIGVPAHVGDLTAVVLHDPGGLLVLTRHTRWKQTAESVLVPLFFAESGSPILPGVVEEVVAAL
jgi:hypothetical protein